MAGTSSYEDAERKVSWFEDWSRRTGPVYAFLPYFMLALAALAAGLSVSQGIGADKDFGVTLAIVGVAAAWILWWDTLHPSWTDRRDLMTIYFVGRLVITAVLVFRNGWFGIFAFGNYFDALRLFPIRWGMVATAVNAVLVSIAQVGGVIPNTAGGLAILGVVVLLNGSLACFFGFFGHVIGEQNDERKLMIAELHDANRKLTETMRENAGLHAQLLTQAREAGVTDERQRMAREIHDTLAQGLAGIITQLQAAEQASDRQAEWTRHLDNASLLARESLAEARRSVHAMTPRALDAAHLPAALAEVVESWSEISGVGTSLTTTGTPMTLHPEIEVALLRVAQEALANVDKHADASRVGLTLSYMEDVVTLDVRDDGAGFDPTAETHSSSGRRIRPHRDAAAAEPGRRGSRGRVRAGRRYGDLRQRPGDRAGGFR